MLYTTNIRRGIYNLSLSWFQIHHIKQHIGHWESLDFIYCLLYWRIGPYYKSALQCLGVSRAVTPRTRGHWAPELFIAIFAGGRQPQWRARVLLPVTWRIMPPPPSTNTQGWIFFQIFWLPYSYRFNKTTFLPFPISCNFPQLSTGTLVIAFLGMWVIISTQNSEQGWENSISKEHAEERTFTPASTGTGIFILSDVHSSLLSAIGTLVKGLFTSKMLHLLSFSLGGK